MRHGQDLLHLPVRSLAHRQFEGEPFPKRKYSLVREALDDEVRSEPVAILEGISDFDGAEKGPLVQSRVGHKGVGAFFL